MRPDETLLVVDAMTGQEAASLTAAFDNAVGLTGAILTKMDGDSRGGAAVSVRGVSGKPIKFVGTGEKTPDLEPFFPDRMASRILGMGDVISLVEKAAAQVSDEEAARQMQKMISAERGSTCTPSAKAAAYVATTTAPNAAHALMITRMLRWRTTVR